MDTQANEKLRRQLEAERREIEKLLMKLSKRKNAIMNALTGLSRSK